MSRSSSSRPSNLGPGHQDGNQYSESSPLLGSTHPSKVVSGWDGLMHRLEREDMLDGGASDLNLDQQTTSSPLDGLRVRRQSRNPFDLESRIEHNSSPYNAQRSSDDHEKIWMKTLMQRTKYYIPVGISSWINVRIKHATEFTC